MKSSKTSKNLSKLGITFETLHKTLKAIQNLPRLLYRDNLLNFLGSYFLTFPKVLKWTTFFPNSGSATSSAASATSSAACIYYVVIGGRFAPPYKYMIKYIQQKQQQQKQQLQQQLHQQQHKQVGGNKKSPLISWGASISWPRQ